MATSPNIMLSNNPAVLDGGQFGTIVAGEGITIDGGATGVAMTGPVTIDGGDVFAGGVVGDTTIAGDLTISGASRRIFGDFSNATATNRTMLQTSTVNGESRVTLLPNGTATRADFHVCNTSDPANTTIGLVSMTSTRMFVGTFAVGTGNATLPVLIGGGNSVTSIAADSNGNCAIGALNAAASTSATNGFLYLPTCAGTPTGVPTAITGKAPMVVDSTNNKLYVYVGGSWVAMN